MDEDEKDEKDKKDEDKDDSSKDEEKDSEDSSKDEDKDKKSDDKTKENPYNALTIPLMENLPLEVDEGEDLPMQNLIEFSFYENLDESYPLGVGTSNPFTNYNGSIMQMIKDVSNKPFDEMFWSSIRGLPTLVYRPTPFDPENWLSLPSYTISREIVTSFNIQNSDEEQASVFKITPTLNVGADTNYDGGLAANLYPITNVELIRRYGYKLLEANTDYFNNADFDLSKQRATAGTYADSEAMKGYTDKSAMLHYPPYTSIEDAFYLTSGRKGNGDLSIPKEYGGQTAYDAYKKASETAHSGNDLYNALSSYGFTQEQCNALATSRNSMSTTKYLSIIAPNYVPTTTNLAKGSHYLRSYKTMKAHPEKAASELMGLLSNSLGPEQAYQLVQSAIKNNGKIPENEYNDIINNIPYDQEHEGVSSTSGKDAVAFFFSMYSEKLFNWYADNAKFYSGSITFNTTGLNRIVNSEVSIVNLDGSDITDLPMFSSVTNGRNYIAKPNAMYDYSTSYALPDNQISNTGEEEYYSALKNYQATYGSNDVTSRRFSNGNYYLGRTLTSDEIANGTMGNAYNGQIYNPTGFIGSRIYFYDAENDTYWEFYCEGEQYNFDYQNGLQTTLTLTRGVAIGPDVSNNTRRFDGDWGFWGQFTNFVGGYFGEQTLATAIENAKSNSGGKGKDSGSADTSDTVKFFKEVQAKNWIYDSGSLRTDFGEIGHPKEGGHGDCSSTVWYVLKSCGYDVGDQAFWTGAMAPFMDKIDESESGPGTIFVNPNHTGMLLEKWNGPNTKIINMGGSGGNIHEGGYQNECGRADYGYLAKPKK